MYFFFCHFVSCLCARAVTFGLTAVTQRSWSNKFQMAHNLDKFEVILCSNIMQSNEAVHLPLLRSFVVPPPSLPQLWGELAGEPADLLLSKFKRQLLFTKLTNSLVFVVFAFDGVEAKILSYAASKMFRCSDGLLWTALLVLLIVPHFHTLTVA